MKIKKNLIRFVTLYEMLAETFAHFKIKAWQATKGIRTNYVNNYDGELDKDRADGSWYRVYL